MSSPFIQIFSVGVMGIAGPFVEHEPSAGGGDRVADLRGRAFYIVGCVQSLLNSGHGVRLARKSHIIAAEITAARGSARPVPAMSGAEPWTGSKSDGPVRAGLRFADAARPMPPPIAPPRSVRMSPNRLSVTITS